MPNDEHATSPQPSHAGIAPMATTAKSSATPKATPSLRRRMHKHMLERAPSLSSLNSLASADLKILPEISHSRRPKGENGHEENDELSPGTDYESRSSSDDEDLDEDETPATGRPGKTSPSRPQRPKIDTDQLSPRQRPKHHSPMTPTSRAWYEFDLAVVVALVSPIGNWLTGGDHIKNLLLVVLLIFYLHQIIEIPWELYQKSRPRRRTPELPALPDDTPETRYAKIAASELRTFEIFFLFLTFASPFFGAYLLRYASAAVLGPQSVSWFSTGLFVLATGMRPWSHLVERVSHRTGDLHNVIHYPTPHSDSEAHNLLERRLAQLEKAMAKMNAKVVHATDEVYEYVDEAVDTVEHSLRKQDRRWEKYEGKVKEVEEAVVGLSKLAKAPERTHNTHYLDRAYAYSLLTYILPKWLVDPPYRNLYGSMYSPSSTIASRHHHSLPSSPSTPLETIVEEEGPNDNLKYPMLARPMWITSSIIFRAGYLMTLPLRAVVRMILRSY